MSFYKITQTLVGDLVGMIMSKSSETNLDPRIEQLIREELKPRRRWLRWGMFLALGLILCLLLAPTILCRTPLRKVLLAQAIPQDAGSLAIDSMSVGWFSPLSVRGVRFADSAGDPLLITEEITGDRSLLALIRDSTNLGSIVISKPSVHLKLRKDGSNLEDVLNQFTSTLTSEHQAPAETSTTGIRAHIKLVDAEVIATEAETQTIWKLQQVNAEAKVPLAADADWIVTASGVLDGQPFSADFASPLGLATADWPLGQTGKATVQAQALPLSPLRYAAQRSGQPIEQLQGSFTSNLTANWQPEANSPIPKLIAQGLVRTDNLVVASRELLGPDVLRLATAQLDTKMHIANNVATIEQGDLNSDYGTASLVTSVNLNSLSDPQAIIETIRRQQLSTSGELDVAALTRALPNTLKIRDDVQIASGRIAWSVASTPELGSASKWTGSLQTADVRVLRNGQAIDWQFPLEVRFQATDGDDIQLDDVSVRSDFFSLVGQGKLRQGKLHAQADLERLVYQLSQVMDLSNIYIRGEMQSILQWNELQPNQLKLDGRTRLVNFAMTQNEQLLCQEAELNATTQATATLNGQQLASLDSARVDVISAGDFMIVELQQPVASPSSESTWHLACRLKGELASWVARLKTMGAGVGWQVAGQIDATTQVSVNPQDATVQSLNVDVRNLQAASDGLAINEPVLQIQTAGSIDLVTLGGQFPETTIASQTVSCTAQNLAIGMQPHFVVSGNVGYRADLARLSAIVPSESGQQIAGGAVGRLALEAKEHTTSFNLDGWIENLTVLEATGAPLWQEPKLTIQTIGTYDGAKDQLDLAQAQIAGRVLNLETKGHITQLTSDLSVDLSGEYGYDLTGIVAIFRDVIGPDIVLTGNQRQRFAMKGPVFPAAPATGMIANDLVAQATFGWDTANAYGIPLGPSQVAASLANGVLQMNPLELAVGEGQVRLAPTLHLNTEAMWMTLPAGPVIEKVRLDPQMTGGWMKYITPLMADATSAEGTFSVTLSRTEVPLMVPMQGRVEGQFDIHGGALGPGPMASQLLDLATQIKQLTGKGTSRIADPTKSWVQLQPQQIDFQMAEGRVYHSGFQMTIDDVLIRTRGSVGIEDQSLAVMAEVPILDEWIEASPHLSGLRGKVISVPIGGTTSSPQLDQRALTQATMQLARDGAAGYLQGQLNEKLGGKLQDALGGSLGGLLGGGQGNTPNGPQQQPPQQQQDLGTQLQNKAQEEIGKQLNKLFK